MRVGGAGVREYLKRAFLYRWNLLLFIGGAAASLLSPWPDGMLPLVLAVEGRSIWAGWFRRPNSATPLTPRYTRKPNNLVCSRALPQGVSRSRES